jgi:hypothetical protein
MSVLACRPAPDCVSAAKFKERGVSRGDASSPYRVKSGGVAEAE